MKKFADYLKEEIYQEEVNQLVDICLQELNVIKAVTSKVNRFIKGPLFKKAVALWKRKMNDKNNKDDAVQTATKVALLTDKLEPREFIDALKQLKLIKA